MFFRDLVRVLGLPLLASDTFVAQHVEESVDREAAPAPILLRMAQLAHEMEVLLMRVHLIVGEQLV